MSKRKNKANAGAGKNQRRITNNNAVNNSSHTKSVTPTNVSLVSRTLEEASEPASVDQSTEDHTTSNAKGEQSEFSRTEQTRSVLTLDDQSVMAGNTFEDPGPEATEDDSNDATQQSNATRPQQQKQGRTGDGSVVDVANDADDDGYVSVTRTAKPEDTDDNADESVEVRSQSFVEPTIVAAPKTPYKINKQTDRDTDATASDEDAEFDEDENDSESDDGITIESKNSRTVETVYAEETAARVLQQKQQLGLPRPAPAALVNGQALPEKAQPKTEQPSVAVCEDSATEIHAKPSEPSSCYLYSHFPVQVNNAAVSDSNVLQSSSYAPPVHETIWLDKTMKYALIRTNVSSTIMLPETYAHEGTLVITSVFEGVHHRVTTNNADNNGTPNEQQQQKQQQIDGGAVRWFVLRGGTTVTLLYIQSDDTGQGTWWRLSEVYRAQSMQLFAPPVSVSSSNSTVPPSNTLNVTTPTTGAPSSKNANNGPALSAPVPGATELIVPSRQSANHQQPYQPPLPYDAAQVERKNRHQHPTNESRRTIPNNNATTAPRIHSSVQSSTATPQTVQATAPASGAARPMAENAVQQTSNARSSSPNSAPSAGVHPTHSQYNHPSTQRNYGVVPPASYQQPQQLPRTITRTYYKPSTTFFGLPNPFKPPIRITQTVPIEDLSSEMSNTTADY